MESRPTFAASWSNRRSRLPSSKASSPPMAQPAHGTPMPRVTSGPTR